MTLWAGAETPAGSGDPMRRDVPRRRSARAVALPWLMLLGVLATPAGSGCASPESSGSDSKTATPAGGATYNLILITLDTTRRDRLSCYGYARPTTPNLDRLAAEGVLFEEAFTPVPVTLPAHTTMLTGLYPFQHGVRHNGCYVLADSFVTLAELLAAKGYETGAVLGAFPVDHRFGLAQGFKDYDDRFSPLTSIREGDTAQRPATEVTRLSLEWIGQHATRPFFLWAHYFDPHAPYHPPEPYLSRFAGRSYDGEVAAMDAAIGQLLEGLKSKGLLDRTVILVVADHGEGLMDHHEPTHSTFIYGATQEVPLLLRLPDAGPWAGKAWHGRRVKGLAGLIDLLPTAWDVLGFDDRELPPVAGRSLRPLVEGRATGHAWLYHETLVPDLDFGMSELRGLQTASWKYIRAPQRELYNLEKDPQELNNLAKREAARADEMEDQLAGILRGEEAASVPVAMDPEAVEKLRSLGYVQGRQPDAGSQRADPKDQLGVGLATARAQSLAEAHRTQEAVAVLDSLLALHPRTRLALRLRALYLTRLERGPAALAAYGAALSDCQGCPDEFRLLQEQANAYLIAGLSDEALKRTRTLLEARPEEQGLHLLLGEVLEKKSDLEGARQAYQREAELFPLETLPLVKLGRLAAAGERAGEAEQAYRKALALNPKDVDALLMLSELLDGTERQAESDRLVDEALAADPHSPDAHYRRAWVLRKRGSQTDAVQHYQAALQARPDDPVVLYELGTLYGQLGRTAEATACYEKAAQTGRAPVGAYYNLGIAAARAGRYADAIEQWQQALSRNPTAEETNTIQASIRRAQGLMSGAGATKP